MQSQVLVNLSTALVNNSVHYVRPGHQNNCIIGPIEFIFDSTCKIGNENAHLYYLYYHVNTAVIGTYQCCQILYLLFIRF